MFNPEAEDSKQRSLTAVRCTKGLPLEILVRRYYVSGALIGAGSSILEDVMRRVLFKWHGIKPYAYPVILYLGLLSAVVAGTYGAALDGLNPVRVYAALLLLIPSALLGARLLFLMARWRLFRGQPHRIWRQLDGGASLYGGLVLSCLISLPLLKILRLPFGAFWDAASVTMLTGMIFTKVGCFLNGCCAGRPTTARLALYLPNHRGKWCQRVPTQLLEAGLAARRFNIMPEYLMLSVIKLTTRLKGARRSGQVRDCRRS